jgi:hypothetical protein
MKHGTGAMIPPGFYAKHEAIAAKFATMKGFVKYDLCAGFNGMAIKITFDAIENVKQAASLAAGIPYSLVPQTSQHVRYTVVDGVEVFFTPN